MMYVLDASVLAKMVLMEGRSQEFRDWFLARYEANDRLLAPHVAFSEAARALQRGAPKRPGSDLAEAHEAIFIGVNVEPVDAHSFTAWEWTNGLSFYDAEYLDLATKREATLVSADSKQLDRARRAGLRTLSFAPK